MRIELGPSATGAPALTTHNGGPAPAPPDFAAHPMVIEGDSITSTTPYQSANHGDFYSHSYADAAPARTILVAAQASRTVGGPFNDPADGPPDGADTGSPIGNTLLLRRDDDLADLEPGSLLFVMIGANDLTTFSVETFLQRLIAWAAPIRAAGVKIAFGVCTPRLEGYSDYDSFMPKWRALFGAYDIRNPAVWGQFADYYVPMGEHPIFVEPGYAWSSDGVHPSGPVSAAGTGQYFLSRVFLAAMATLHDTSRANSTGIYNTTWPADPVDLPLSTQVEVRIPLSGLAWAGTNVTVSVSGDGSPEIRRGGGSWGSGAISERMYNGDIISVRTTTSASYSTTVSVTVTINGAAHTIKFPTLASSEYTATFDPAKKSANCFLSNGNKTFAGSDFGSVYPTRGATDTALSDPTGYVEFTLAKTAHAYRDHAIGLVNAAYSFAGLPNLGTTAGSFAFEFQGIYYAGSSTVVNFPGSAWDYNGVVGMLIHKASGKAWLRTNNGWFPEEPTFDAEGELLTGAGVDTGLTDFYFAAGQTDDSTLTVNAGQTPFVYAPPANVTPGWK